MHKFKYYLTTILTILIGFRAMIFVSLISEFSKSDKTPFPIFSLVIIVTIIQCWFVYESFFKPDESTSDPNSLLISTACVFGIIFIDVIPKIFEQIIGNLSELVKKANC